MSARKKAERACGEVRALLTCRWELWDCGGNFLYPSLYMSECLRGGWSKTSPLHHWDHRLYSKLRICWLYLTHENNHYSVSVTTDYTVDGEIADCSWQIRTAITLYRWHHRLYCRWDIINFSWQIIYEQLFLHIGHHTLYNILRTADYFWPQIGA